MVFASTFNFISLPLTHNIWNVRLIFIWLNSAWVENWLKKKKTFEQKMFDVQCVQLEEVPDVYYARWMSFFFQKMFMEQNANCQTP